MAAGGGQFEHKMWTFIIFDLLYRNFQTQLFEILLFCLVKTTNLFSKNHKFPKENSDVISIQIDPHLKMLLKNTKSPDFMKHGVEGKYSLKSTDPRESEIRAPPNPYHT